MGIHESITYDSQLEPSNFPFFISLRIKTEMYISVTFIEKRIKHFFKKKINIPQSEHKLNEKNGGFGKLDTLLQ